jgi:hypothetical protein
MIVPPTGRTVTVDYAQFNRVTSHPSVAPEYSNFCGQWMEDFRRLNAERTPMMALIARKKRDRLGRQAKRQTASGRRLRDPSVSGPFAVASDPRLQLVNAIRHMVSSIHDDDRKEQLTFDGSLSWSHSLTVLTAKHLRDYLKACAMLMAEVNSDDDIERAIFNVYGAAICKPSLAIGLMHIWQLQT